jgi:uncharacterized membrane protein YdjX (TVP38/TMEM64 family)
MSPLFFRCPASAARLRQALLAPWTRFTILVALLAAAAAAVVVLEPQRLLTEGRLTQVPGAWALLSFAAAFATCTTAFVPRPLLNVAGGALFGAQLGMVAGLTGTVLGAAASFGVGRLLGQDALRPLLRNRLLTAADRQMSRHGFRSMLVVRLLPGIPFAGSNFAAAVSRMRWSSFLTASALGSVPSTAAYVVAGSHASTPTSPAFLAAFSFIALTGIGGAFVAWRKRRKLRAAPAAPIRTGEVVPADGAAQVSRVA